MIRIEELYRLHGLGSLRLIAGESGLSRRVTAAVLFEYDPSRMRLADFYRGDLVVTTLAYARGDEALVSRTLVTLMNQGVAGLLIKTAYFRQMPAAVVRMADRLGTPIFLFDDTYIEEVILQVTELIRGSRHFSGHERELEALMSGGLSEAQAREKARALDPVGADRHAVTALYPLERMPDLEDRVYDALYGDGELSHKFVCCAWQRMLLVLRRMRADEEDGGADELLDRAGLRREALCLGESAPCGEAMLGEAMREAVYAARAARLTGVPRLSGDALGLYAYLLPLSENAFARKRCLDALQRLREYDRRSGASLEVTARTYVEKGMQITATAKALFQHQNTVRYRLAKISQLLGVPREELLAPTLLIAVRLAQIVESEL